MSTTSDRPRRGSSPRLAARHPGSPVPADAAALAEYFQFTDFAKFVEIYLSVVDLITTPDDVRLLTYEVAREMAGQNIRYSGSSPSRRTPR